MMVNGTVVKRWSRSQASHALSTEEAECYSVIIEAPEVSECSAINDDGLGTECTGAGMVRLQRNRSDCLKKRTRTFLRLTGGDQISGGVKMKRVRGEPHLADPSTKGKSWWETDELI